MKKYDSMFITFVIATIFYGWLGYTVDRGHMKTIGSLRSSIIEARQLLNSPINDLNTRVTDHPGWLTDSNISRSSLQKIKGEIENAQMILENAQNSLELDRNK